MIRRPPRSTLFPYTNALPICDAHVERHRRLVQIPDLGAPEPPLQHRPQIGPLAQDRKSTRLNSSHLGISYAVFCLKKKKKKNKIDHRQSTKTTQQSIVRSSYA